LDKFWRDLIFAACGKDPGKMNEVVKMDVFDFFAYIDNIKSNG
jgi:hypothetical protein